MLASIEDRQNSLIDLYKARATPPQIELAPPVPCPLAVPPATPPATPPAAPAPES
jgi:hypothetical protein